MNRKYTIDPPKSEVDEMCRKLYSASDSLHFIYYEEDAKLSELCDDSASMIEDMYNSLANSQDELKEADKLTNRFKYVLEEIASELGVSRYRRDKEDPDEMLRIIQSEIEDIIAEKKQLQIEIEELSLKLSYLNEEL